MTQTIRVSKAGKNVLTESNFNNYIFYSDKNTFKILATGLLTSQTVDANPKTFTVAHEQSVTPNFFAFCEFPDGKVATPNSKDYTYQPYSSDGYGQFDVEVDATNLYFILTKPSSNYNVNIRYYLFEGSL